VRLEHGIISSSVFIRVQGYDRDKGLLKNGKEEGEIDGLSNKEAQDLSDYLNRRQEQIEAVAEGDEVQGQMDNGMGAYVYCSKCGTKDSSDAKFCGNCGAKLE
jgi:membrane protease subunit (stomatin/prohibitin family)